MYNKPSLDTNSSLRMAQASLELTKKVLERYRYRLAGTCECRQAGHKISETLRKSCDKSREESFTLRPKALWYLGKVIAIMYLLSTVSIIVGGQFVYAGCVLCLIGFVYGLSQYVFYWTLFDPMFKSAEGCNLVGTLEPTGTVERQVILVGHHDSPYIFNFLERFQAIAFIRFILGIAFYVRLCIYSVLLSIQQYAFTRSHPAQGVALWITVVGALFTLQLFFMMSRRSSPGVGDNLNATSMNAEVARYFSDERKKGSPLRHTRLIILSTDGEECGQRGAIEYVKRHFSELNAIRTYVLNIDSVYYYKDLTVLTRDRNYTCTLSRTMVAMLREVAFENNIRIKSMPIPFGGGGTDAAAFAAAGIEATTLIAQPTGLISRGHLYHTSKDVVEGIDIEVVKAVVEITVGFVRKIDDTP